MSGFDGLFPKRWQNTMLLIVMGAFLVLAAGSIIAQGVAAGLTGGGKGEGTPVLTMFVSGITGIVFLLWGLVRILGGLSKTLSKNWSNG